MPVPGDVNPPRNPDLVMGLHIVDKFHQPYGAGRGLPNMEVAKAACEPGRFSRR